MPSVEPVKQPAETMSRADAAISRATEAISKATNAAALSGTPLGSSSRVNVPPITADMPVGEAAALLAQQMRRIPGIERHLAIPLGELDQRGPRPVRAAWRLARDRVADSYGAMTVGELLSRFDEATGGSAPRRDDPSLSV